MAMKIYRITLEQSNPRVIREIQINDKRTFRQFLKTIALVHGWKIDNPMVQQTLKSPEYKDFLNYKMYQLFDSEKARKKNYIRISFPCIDDYVNTANYITFRVEEILHTEEDAIDHSTVESMIEPQLIRFQGLNLSSEITSISMWNRLHHQLLFQRYYTDYHVGMIRLEDLLPKERMINNNLKIQIFEGRKEIVFDREKSLPLVNILESHTVATLKSMICFHGIDIQYNVKKAVLINRLVSYFNQPSMWEKILKEMTLQEYETFLKICHGKLKSNTIHMDILDGYCMITSDNTYWANPKIPSELIDYFMQMCYEGQDTILYEMKKISMVLNVCRLLYGVFSKKQAYRITEIMFPGEFEISTFENYWKSEDDFVLLNNNVMYYSLSFQKEQAAILYKENEMRGIPYYTPDKEILFEISRYGLHFKGEAYKEIQSAIDKMVKQSYWYVVDSEMITKAIYDLYRLGWNRKDAEKYLRKQYHLEASSKKYKLLFDLVDKYKDEIRMLPYRGNTTNWMKSQSFI